MYFLSEKVGRKLFMILGLHNVRYCDLLCAGAAKTAPQLLFVSILLRFFSEIGVCSATIYTPEIFPLHIRVLGTSTSMGLGGLAERLARALSAFL